jgi:uncharacterized membrane protein
MSTSSERGRVWRIVIGFAVALGAVILAYPYALGAALESIGVRGVGLGLFALAATSFLLPGRGLPHTLARGAAPALALPLLLALAAASGDGLYLLLVPAVVYLTLAAVFLASLRERDSLIERAARFLVPQAPGFIRSYCRKVTALWVALFAACAAVVVCLAVTGETERWETFTGWGVYALMLAVSAVEFLVRKTWFRYYFHGGPFERLWSRLFPAEATARGRESLEHIRRYRAELEARRPGPERRA